LDKLWSGKLLSGQNLDVLVVFDKGEVILTKEKLTRFVVVQHLVRSKQSGELIWENVPLNEGTTPIFSRRILSVTFLVGPFVLCLIGLAIYLIILSRGERGKRGDTPLTAFQAQTQGKK